MMSWAEAERRGISRDKMVFIHGSGDGFDANTISLRLIMRKACLCKWHTMKLFEVRD